MNNVKNEGGFDNKYVVLRMDIEECKKNYEDDVDEEGNVVGSHLQSIDFQNSNNDLNIKKDEDLRQSKMKLQKNIL